MLQIFDKLLLFPLFQGMSRDDLELVAGHTRFGFAKAAQGRTVVCEGDVASLMYLLVSGKLTVETRSVDHAYRVVETLQAPLILQPEAIFGYNQRYTHTYTAAGPCSLITIEKQEVVRLSEDFLVFRLNLLNIFATQTQKLALQPWRARTNTLEERLVRFFIDHCAHPAGPKTFYILMTRLADELGVKRLNISHALNRMQQDGLLTLHRGRIEIPLAERLLNVK